MGRLDIRIDITNATKDESEKALAEVLESMRGGRVAGDIGDLWRWSAKRRDDDETSGFGCAPTDLPDWITEYNGRHEHTIDGQRYLRTDHVVLAVRGKARERENMGAASLMLAVEMGIEAGLRQCLFVRLDTPAKPSAVYLPDDESGERAEHYRVDLLCAAKAFAARYVAIIERLYPGCTWWTGAAEYAQARDVEGRVVAVLMPTRDAARG